MHRFEDYPATDALPWLDRPDALEAIARKEAAGELDAAEAELCRHWHAKGFVTLEGILEDEVADGINADVERIYEANKHLPIGELRYKFQDIFPASEATRQAMMHPRILDWMDRLLGDRALPYQSLSFPVSSQLGAHVDQILMTTHPPGFMAAAWFALEDVQPDAGPVYVLPGSHRLPYVGAREVGIPRGADEAECGRVYDQNYYDLMKEAVAAAAVEPHTYLSKKGDVLIWHSNLIHGAHPKERDEATRKSLIVHYFGASSEPYSDLFQRRCDLPGLRAAEED